MSDARVGWAELLAAPLGPEAPEDLPLATLPCLVPRPAEPGLQVGLREP